MPLTHMNKAENVRTSSTNANNDKNAIRLAATFAASGIAEEAPFAAASIKLASPEPSISTLVPAYQTIIQFHIAGMVLKSRSTVPAQGEKKKKKGKTYTNVV